MLPGVLSSSVALLSESAEVTFDAAVASEGAVVEAVEAAGFEARVVTSRRQLHRGASTAEPHILKLEVNGMHCSACSSAVEAALRALPGVQTAAVSLALRQAEVRCLPGVAAPTPAELVSTVEDAGFEAKGECVWGGRGCRRRSLQPHV